MLQAWDFVPGTNFIDFMDRGVSEADLVVAVLSRNYLQSRYGRLEWQAALRADPDNRPTNSSRSGWRTARSKGFATCEADDVRPQPPYWPKWRHFSNLFKELFQGLDGPAFDSAQPWTLFDLPELRVAVAGLNSTIAMSHREEDNHGYIGEAQARKTPGGRVHAGTRA
ncbi:hypothetical protein ABH927_001099 [Planotetraspora sp. GP83]